MNRSAFYSGILHELHKQANIAVNGEPLEQPQRKQHSWLPALATAGLGLGAGLAGYHYWPQIKSMFSAAPQPTPAPSAMHNFFNYARQNPGKVLGAVTGSHDISNFRADPGKAVGALATDTQLAAAIPAAYAGVGRAVSLPGSQTAGRIAGKMFGSAAGVGAGAVEMANAIGNKDNNSPFVRGVQGLGGATDIAVNTPLGGQLLAKTLPRSVIQNYLQRAAAAQVPKNFIARGLTNAAARQAAAKAALAAGTDAAGAEALGAALGPAGWIATGAGIAGKAGIEHATNMAQEHSGNFSNFSDTLLGLRRMAHSGDPEQMQNAIRYWQVLHENPQAANYIKSVTKPGLFARLGYGGDLDMSTTQHLYDDLHRTLQQHSNRTIAAPIE